MPGLGPGIPEFRVWQTRGWSAFADHDAPRPGASLQKPDADFEPHGADAFALQARPVFQFQNEDPWHRGEVADAELGAGIREIANEAVDHALVFVEEDLGTLHGLVAAGHAARARAR